MKYKITYLLILFMCSSVYAIDKPTKIRITNGEWEPYHSKLAYQYGFNSHVVARAFELAGIKVEWGSSIGTVLMSWQSQENGMLAPLGLQLQT